LCLYQNVIVVTFGGYFSSPKNFLTAAEDMVRHFAESLVGDGSGAITYLDRCVGDRTRTARTHTVLTPGVVRKQSSSNARR
jgi:hypothetical protein